MTADFRGRRKKVNLGGLVLEALVKISLRWFDMPLIRVRKRGAPASGLIITLLHAFISDLRSDEITR